MVFCGNFLCHFATRRGDPCGRPKPCWTKMISSMVGPAKMKRAANVKGAATRAATRKNRDAALKQWYKTRKPLFVRTKASW
jgi:hypothetical protein